MIYIIWDDEDNPRGNVAHLADNDVAPDEFEEILADDATPHARSRSSGRPMKRGLTRSGQDLVIVYEIESQDPSVVRPVTAFAVSGEGGD